MWTDSKSKVMRRRWSFDPGKEAVAEDIRSYLSRR